MDAVSYGANQALNETKTLHEEAELESAKVRKLEALYEDLRQKFEAANVGFKRDKFDPAMARVRFTGFKDTDVDDDKVKAIQDFMRTNFKTVRVMHTDHFSKKASFVQLSTPKITKFVLDTAKAQKMTVVGYSHVEIKPALTAIDMSRNYALFKAEELIKEDPKSANKTVETRMGKDRGVYVSNIEAFRQKERFDPKGSFEGEFVHLRLP